MKRVCLLALVAQALAVSEPSLFYSKFFKGSTPEFVSINIERNGRVTFKEALDDPAPIIFELQPPETEEIFGLADKLDHFKHEVESGLKVAHMGVKTFRFVDGGETHEVKFNYSIDTDAHDLAEWFERISETEERRLNLDSSIHFDKLGVNQALLELQVVWERKRLVCPKQFLPLLARIAKNDSFLHMARERAAALADAFEHPAAKAPAP